MPKAHLSQTGVFKGVLSRNATYKKDARGKMVGDQLYSTGKEQSVLTAIKKRDKALGRPDGRYANGKLIKGKTQAERAKTYPITYGKNFKSGYHPYLHQAHHVIPTEVFYDKKWKAKHLNVLQQVKYDINNDKNIIYLPQGERGQTFICEYHMLPNHAKNHDKYNARLKREMDAVYDMIEEALEDSKCPPPEVCEKILKKIEQIQDTNFRKLKDLGPKDMPS